ncbi:MAG: SAM-dependent methyltransferase [Thermodesulfobacteriota bacterium]
MSDVFGKKRFLFRLCMFFLSAVLVSCIFQQSPLAGEKKSGGQFRLVSLGVGDPDLITVRAIERIRESDIIICRQSVEKDFQEYLEEKTVWEGAFDHWRTWDRDCGEIADAEKREKCESDRKVRKKLEEKIRKAVDEGKTVSVLGQGDLMIYGGPYRWYLDALKDLEPEIVPGVSAFNAANASLGKDIMTGGKTSSAVLTHYRDIDKVAQNQPTLIIFTMHTKFKDLVEKLGEYYPEDTPVSVVFYAGYKEKEYSISGTLDTIRKKTEGEDFPFEHLVYVGDFMK